MQQERSTREPLNFCENLILQEQAKAIRNIRDDAPVIVRNLLGIELWPKQQEIIQEFYDPEKNYKELVLCAGMRSGKSFLAAIIAHIETIRWLMLHDPWDYYGIIPGTEIYGLMTAVSQRQVRKFTFMYYKKLLERSWYYKSIDVEPYADSVRFPGRGLEVMAVPSTSASQVGGTLLFAVMDEVARFVDTDGARSGDMVHTALQRGTRTLNGKTISISSPIFVRDKIMRLLEDAENARIFASRKNQFPAILGYHYPTWVINPNIAREDLGDDYRRDPEKAKRDWGAEPSHAIEPYFMEPEKIQMDQTRDTAIITESGEVQGLYRIKGARYYLHGDPAVRNDAFGLAVAHLERETHVIVDLLHRFVPPPGGEINANAVKQAILNIHRVLNLQGATFDTWNYPETIQRLKDMRIPVEMLTVNKAVYDNLKERIYSNTISIPRHKLETRNPRIPETVIDELKELELVRGTKVDHPSGGAKDVADAIAGAVWGATSHARTRRYRKPRAGPIRR